MNTQTSHQLHLQPLECRRMLTATAFERHTIHADNPVVLNTIELADFDNDGDLDVFSGNSWLENDGTGEFVAHLFDDATDRTDATLIDFDGDSDVDIVFAEDRAIHLWENIGGGRFKDAVVIVESAAVDHRHNLVAADFDGDDDIDFAYDFDEDYVQVRFNNDGDFTELVDLEGRVGGDGVEQISTTDLGNDGYLDLLVSADDGGDFYVFRGSADGFARSEKLFDDVGNTFHLADIDGDRDDDLVIYQYVTQRLVWYDQDPTGQFVTSHTIKDGNFAPANVVDIDSDGDFDVFSCGIDGCEEESSEVGWFINEGGTFASETIPIVDMNLTAVRAGDVDNDGNVDIIATRNGYELVVISQNDGSFSDIRSHFTQPSGFTDSLVADFTGDGRVDIVNYSRIDQSLQWREQLDLKMFSDTRNVISKISPVHANSFALVESDIDGDGDLDIVTSTAGPLRGDGPTSHLRWLENENGRFTAHAIGEFRNFPIGDIDLAMNDMDGDGDLDIIATRLAIARTNGTFGSRGDVVWFENVGEPGSFGADPIVVHTGGDGGIFMHVNDFDNDGDMDIATASVPAERDGGGLRIHLNRGDGRSFDEMTASASFGAYGLSAITSADIDGDGFVEIIVGSRDGRILQFDNVRAGRFSHGHSIDTLLGLSAREAVSLRDREVDVELADIDGDGDVDLAASFAGVGRLIWYENVTGRGDFSRIHVIANDVSNIETFNVSDVDSDGDVDFVAGTSRYRLGPYYAAEQYWFENRLIGDVNDDGVFDSVDLIELFQAGQYEDDTAGNSTFDEGDFNGDGDFTTEDLVALFQSGTFGRGMNVRP